MPQTTKQTPLTNDERRPFAAWARSRPGFRDCQQPRLAGGLRIHDGCCTSILQGTVYLAAKPVPLAALVDQWRSVGRPDAPVRRRAPQRRADQKRGA